MNAGQGEGELTTAEEFNAGIDAAVARVRDNLRAAFDADDEVLRLAMLATEADLARARFALAMIEGEVARRKIRVAELRAARLDALDVEEPQPSRRTWHE